MFIEMECHIKFGTDNSNFEALQGPTKAITCYVTHTYYTAAGT